MESPSFSLTGDDRHVYQKLVDSHCEIHSSLLLTQTVLAEEAESSANKDGNPLDISCPPQKSTSMLSP